MSRSSDPFYVAIYYIRWVTTSWKYSIMMRTQTFFFLQIYAGQCSICPPLTHLGLKLTVLNVYIFFRSFAIILVLYHTSNKIKIFEKCTQ